MAPRGRGSKPQVRQGRATQGAPAASKASTRGGIRKKRAGVDVDGDLSMDAAVRKPQKADGPSASKGRGDSSSASTNRPRGPSRIAQGVLKHLNHNTENSRVNRTRDKDLTWLRVRGLKESKASANADGGVPDLKRFLERKAASFVAGPGRREVRIRKHDIAGDYMFIGASREDAEEILKVNSFQFAGTNLEIVESTGELAVQSKAMESKDTQEVRAKLQEVLGQRYMGSSKLLKLDSLAQDPILVTMGTFDNRDRALKTFKGLMAICDNLFKTAKEKQEAIESISLATNNIDDIAQVEMAASTFPSLKNLDLSGNQIATLDALKPWKGKLKEMVTLYITGNPVESTDPSHRATLLDWFPKLQIINGDQVRTPEEIAAKAEASRPKPIPQNGPDFRDVNGIGEKFLLEFFNLYDGDRGQLAVSLYDDDSQFSLSVDNRRDPNAGPQPSWQSYLSKSRNLLRITTVNGRLQRLFRGANVIADVWRQLPLTKHPNLKDNLSSWIMDCHPLGGLPDPTGHNPVGVDGMALSVHGEFEEYDQTTKSKGKRSFSRAFVLGPGKPGGPPIRVVSDLFSLRAYSSLPNVFEQPAPAQQAQEPRQQQQAMIAELCRQTSMTPQYSEMCLAQVNWNFDQALVIFNEKKAQLPPDAFAQP